MNEKIVSKPGRTQALFQRAGLHDFRKSRKIAASNLPLSVKWGAINCAQGYVVPLLRKKSTNPFFFPFFFFLERKYSQ